MIYITQMLVTGSQLDDDSAGAKSLVAIGLQVCVLAGLLAWRRFPERFAQTLSALAAVGIVFNAVTWILLTRSESAADQTTVAMAWLAVFIWSLFVDANIYRHALLVKLPVGMLIAVLTLAASYALLEALFIGAPD